MKVKELIEMLEKYDPEMEVVKRDPGDITYPAYNADVTTVIQGKLHDESFLRVTPEPNPDVVIICG